MKNIVKAGIALAIIFGIIYLILAAYVGVMVSRNDQRPADAIVVLGAVSYKGESYNPCLVARVAHGVELYKSNLAPKIVMSGGTDREIDKNEAETMKEIAMQMGVAGEDILIEPRSTSTYENLLFSQKVMRLQNLRSAIIVSEPFHMARIGMVAEKLGYNYELSPATTSQCWQRWKYLSRYFWREPISIIYYYVNARI